MYLFRIIYQYFEEVYFSASLNGTYENLDFKGTVTTLLMLVGGLCLGILIASFVIVFQKRVLGRFVRRLLSEHAEDVASAKSLAELGFEKSGLIKSELSRPSVTRKLVSVVREDGSVASYEDELRRAFPEFAEDAGLKRSETDEKTANESIDAADLIPDADKADGKGKPVLEKTKAFFMGKRFKLTPIDFATARFFIPEALRYRAEFRFREKGSSPWYLVLAVILTILLFLLCLRFIPAFVNMLDISISNIKGQ